MQNLKVQQWASEFAASVEVKVCFIVDLLAKKSNRDSVLARSQERDVIDHIT
jgi:hypothetical protein